MKAFRVLHSGMRVDPDELPDSVVGRDEQRSDERSWGARRGRSILSSQRPEARGQRAAGCACGVSAWNWL